MTAPEARPGKVDVVVENWFPRFLANGLDYLDVRRTLDAVAGWDDWAPAWSATARDYEALGLRALDEGHRVTAAEHLRRAALTLQFAQFVLTEQPEHRRALQRRQAELYARCAPLLDPPAARVTVPYDGGEVVGYLRVPESSAQPAPGPPAAPGLVLLVPGLESTKEQFSTYEPFFLRRGVATLSVEGPGQGEGGWEVAFSSARYAAAMVAVGRAGGRAGGRHPRRDRPAAGGGAGHQLRRVPRAAPRRAGAGPAGGRRHRRPVRPGGVRRPPGGHPGGLPRVRRRARSDRDPPRAVRRDAARDPRPPRRAGAGGPRGPRQHHLGGPRPQDHRRAGRPRPPAPGAGGQPLLQQPRHRGPARRGRLGGRPTRGTP